MPQRRAVPDDSQGLGGLYDSENRRAVRSDGPLAIGLTAWDRESGPLVATQNGAVWNVPNTVVQQLLGRLPPGGLATGTTVVPLLDADHRLYGPRRNQLDMRFAKIIRWRSTRANVGVDVVNLFNSNQATAYQAQYDYVQPNGGSWYDPTAILQPRFARFSVTFDF